MHIKYEDIEQYIPYFNIAYSEDDGWDLFNGLACQLPPTLNCHNCPFFMKKGGRCGATPFENPQLINLIDILKAKNPELFI